MKDGYYLSTYLYCNELAHIMDIKMRHNQNVALWLKKDNEVELIHYWELERLSGKKQHAESFYDYEELKEILQSLLKEYNISLDDINEVWGTPGIDTEEKENYTSINDVKKISYHSVAHLFSGLMFDSKRFYNEDIIALAVDSGPDNVVQEDAYEKEFYAGAVSFKGEVTTFSIYSPGKLWSRAKKIFSMREGSLMALATASTSELLNFNYSINIDCMKDMDARKEAGKIFDSLLEVIENLKEEDIGNLFTGYDERFSIEDNKISMAMKIIQKYSTEIMQQNIEQIIKKYKLDPTQTLLCLSGGYALNCPTNSFLMEHYGFKEFIAPPCVNDAGMSLGIGMYSFYKKLKNEKVKINIKHPYYGDKDDSLNDVLTSEEFKKFVKHTSVLNVDQVVDDIIANPIVWFNERSEIGPRALGNRSLIGDPRSERTKDILNVIKEREWWRPVAPIVLEEEGARFFKNFRSSPFMLQNLKLKQDKSEIVPAIAHLDNTSRVQTLVREDNEEMYKIISKFKEKTGIPMICNTSLNDKNEPIINSVKEAFNFALRKDITVIYINKIRIVLQNHKLYEVKDVYSRQLEGIKELSSVERDIKMKELNPHNVSQDMLIYYYDNPTLQASLDLTKEEDVIKLTHIASAYVKEFPLSFVRT